MAGDLSEFRLHVYTLDKTLPWALHWYEWEGVRTFDKVYLEVPCEGETTGDEGCSSKFLKGNALRVQIFGKTAVIK